MSIPSKDHPDTKNLLNPKLVARIRLAPQMTAIASIVIGLFALIGWGFDITFFKSISPQFVTMKVDTAIGLILSGYALFLLHRSESKNWRFKLGRFIGLLVLALGALSLFYSSRSTVAAPTTSVCFVLLGIAFWAYEKLFAHRHPWSHTFAMVVVVIAFFSGVEYLYGARFLLGWAHYTDMALPSAVALLLLSFGILTSRIDHDLIALLLSNGPGASIARKLIPPAILIPLLLGGLRVAGERRELFTAQFGTALFTTLFVSTIVGIIWHQSLHLQRSEMTKNQLNRERDSLRVQEELREQFISMLTHDLRNPLTVVRTCAELLSRPSLRPIDPKKLSAQITNSVARADQMIQNLLDANRVRAGHPLPIKIEFCDLQKLIHETVDELNTVYGKRFHLETPLGDLFGYWDASALRRALENLAGNAIKYGKSGAPVTLTVQGTSDSVQLSVHNFGHAISPEQQTELFEPYQRATHATHSGKRGWGIGLSLVRAIAQAHHGQISVESSAEKGTSFILNIPVDSRL
jgi:signal transduction histidine kinase